SPAHQGVGHGAHGSADARSTGEARAAAAEDARRAGPAAHRHALGRELSQAHPDEARRPGRCRGDRDVARTYRRAGSRATLHAWLTTQRFPPKVVVTARAWATA